MQRQFNFIYYSIFLLVSFAVKAPGSEVFYTAKPGEKYVNMGPVYVGDSVSTSFTLSNTSGSAYSILPVAPSYVLYASPTAQTPDEFLLFDQIFPGLPVKVPANESQNLIMRFVADPDVTAPFGRKEASLRLGLVRPEDSSVVVADTFLLAAKKTKLQLDGYEDAIAFDSVYVSPSVPPEASWVVKSVFRDNLKVEMQDLNYVTVKTSEEFDVETFETAPVFPTKYQTNSWQVKYNPKDLKADTAFFRLGYKPAPEAYPDSIEFCRVRLSGVGVRQRLELANSNFEIKGDTVDLGQVDLGVDTSVELDILNAGNITFGAVNTRLLSWNGSEAEGFTLLNKFLEGQPNLKPGKTAKIRLNARLSNRGYFLVKCEIESDALSRKIKSTPLTAAKVVFYVRGESTSPVPVIPFDTLDFGNVFNYDQYCDAKADSVIMLRNSGNRELIITDIKIENESPNPAFEFSKTTLRLAPGGSDTLTVRFMPPESNQYGAEALFLTNAPHPWDSLKLQLRGASVRPVVTSIYLDSVLAAPGRTISVALRVDSAARFAGTFTDTLFYDRSLLKFQDYRNEGTASDEPMESIIIKEVGIGGRLAVHLAKPPRARFLPKDTLILLNFRTFLGDAAGTSISFLEPRFGNENCSNVLFISAESIHSGWYGIDSVCGLDRKAFKRESGFFSFDEITPNPAVSSVAARFEMAYKTHASLSIYNEYGEEVARLIDDELDKGIHEINGPISQLSRGVYYCVLSAGNFREIRKFVKAE